MTAMPARIMTYAMPLAPAWERPKCATPRHRPLHVICPREQAEGVERSLRELPGVQDVLVARVGGPARIVS